MSKIRVTRVLVYEGEADFVYDQLEGSWLRPGREKTANRCNMQEITRDMMVLPKEEQCLTPQPQ